MGKLSTKEKQRLKELKDREQPVPIPKQFSKSSVITPRMMATFLDITLDEALRALIDIQGPTEPEQILHKTAIRALCKRYGTHLPWGEPIYSESTGIEDKENYVVVERPKMDLDDFAEFLGIEVPRLKLLIKNRCKKTYDFEDILPETVIRRICVHLGKRAPKGMS
jgi:hypothetical protein